MHIKPGQLRCPRCLALDVVPSLPRGVADRLMKFFHRLPRHCRVCGRRFYASEERIQRAQEPPAGESPAL